MALVVETGVGTDGATSYVSLVDAQAFIDARGLSDTLTEPLLLRAMDALEALRFAGHKSDLDNPLSWPRAGVIDHEGKLIDHQSVPARVVAAQVWLAHYIVSGSDPADMPTPAIRSERVDVIETVYAASMGSAVRVEPRQMPRVADALRGLLVTPGVIDRA